MLLPRRSRLKSAAAVAAGAVGPRVTIGHATKDRMCCANLPQVAATPGVLFSVRDMRLAGAAALQHAAGVAAAAGGQPPAPPLLPCGRLNTLAPLTRAHVVLLILQGTLPLGDLIPLALTLPGNIAVLAGL